MPIRKLCTTFLPNGPFLFDRRAAHCEFTGRNVYDLKIDITPQSDLLRRALQTLGGFFEARGRFDPVARLALKVAVVEVRVLVCRRRPDGLRVPQQLSEILRAGPNRAAAQERLGLQGARKGRQSKWQDEGEDPARERHDQRRVS